MTEFKPHFIATDISLEERVPTKDGNLKGEQIAIRVILASSGKTDEIPNLEILENVTRRLQGEIPGAIDYPGYIVKAILRSPRKEDDPETLEILLGIEGRIREEIRRIERSGKDPDPEG